MLVPTVASILASHAIGRLRERVRPNRFAPNLTDQKAIAIAQAGELRPGTSGLTGSEREWFDRQAAGTIGWIPAVQDVTAWMLPAAWTRAGDPGADRSDPTVLADVRRGPVRLTLPAWGQNQRGIPHVIPGRINEPKAVTPLPRVVAAARAAGSPQAEADAWDQLYAG